MVFHLVDEPDLKRFQTGQLRVDRRRLAGHWAPWSVGRRCSSRATAAATSLTS
jgi:hypothetical protein